MEGLVTPGCADTPHISAETVAAVKRYAPDVEFLWNRERGRWVVVQVLPDSVPPIVVSWKIRGALPNREMRTCRFQYMFTLEATWPDGSTDGFVPSAEAICRGIAEMCPRGDASFWRRFDQQKKDFEDWIKEEDKKIVDETIKFYEHFRKHRMSVTQDESLTARGPSLNPNSTEALLIAGS